MTTDTPQNSPSTIPRLTADDVAAMKAVVALLLDERLAGAGEVDREQALTAIRPLGQMTTGGVVALSDLGVTLINMSEDIARARVVGILSGLGR